MKNLLIVVLVYCSLLFNVGLNAQTITHLEPPFWWADMTNDTLQVMIHGDNVGLLKPVIDDKSIEVLSVVYPDNENYIFLYLGLNNAKNSFKIDFYDENKRVESYDYELKQRKQGSKNRIGFSGEDVIYLLMPDRFANGDPSNDNNSSLKEKINRKDIGGRHGGDIRGIINQLPYIEELGATTIWSTPLLQDDVPTFSYHGYAISDYYQIDARYGSNEEYKELSNKLHDRNMKLIMDVVTNHCSSVHWWMNDLPFEDWIHQFDGFQRSNYRMTTQFDPYKAEEDFKLCEKGWFDNTMPDMNQSNVHLIRYLTQNTIWWVEYADLDGLRVDTYSYNDKKGIAYFTNRIMEEYPLFNIVGEVWMHSQAEIAYWQKDNTLSGDYNTGLPSVIDFPLYDVLGSVFEEEEATWDKGMIKLYNNFAQDFVYPNPSNIVVLGENHDTQRLWNLLGGDLNKYKLLMSLLATTRGIPQLYYGTEIGMTGDKHVGDGDIRRDFPGGWVDDGHNAFIKEKRTERENEIFNFTKTLLNWRKNASVVHSGKLQHYVPEDNVYVYFRYLEDKLVMVILNNNSTSEVITTDRFQDMLKGRKKFVDVINGKKVVLGKSINLEAKSAMILECQGK